MSRTQSSEAERLELWAFKFWRAELFYIQTGVKLKEKKNIKPLNPASGSVILCGSQLVLSKGRVTANQYKVQSDLSVLMGAFCSRGGLSRGHQGSVTGLMMMNYILWPPYYVKSMPQSTEGVLTKMTYGGFPAFFPPVYICITH